VRTVGARAARSNMPSLLGKEMHKHEHGYAQTLPHFASQPIWCIYFSAEEE